MIDAMRIATGDLVQFLEANLSGISIDWWGKHVVDRLSFQQQRTVRERGHTSLRQLDFAALLRVLDQNWYELSNILRLPREGRSWVKELQTVRNNWAHLSTEAMPRSEVYLDADTLGRLLTMVEADRSTIEAVESIKADALASMAGSGSPASKTVSDAAAQTGGQPASPGTVSLFKVGDLVALRSDPGVHLPVLEVIAGGAECRYRVFQNNARATYYESQLQAASAAADDRQVLTVQELHAHLTGLQILSPSTANLFSLRSGRVKFVPYQYRPVLRLIRADRPRLLIADEEPRSDRGPSRSAGKRSRKEEAGQYLRSLYTTDGGMICQVCRTRLPFRLDNGLDHFEKVEFLPELERRHYQNYLALCPNHAAMFQLANGSEDTLLRKFLELSGNELEVVLAQKSARIRFHAKHILDLKKVIEVDQTLPAYEVIQGAAE